MGRVRSNKFKKTKILKPGDNGTGYKYVALRINNKYSNKIIHRLVAEAFIPNLFNKTEVNHIDSNRENNKVDNLEWTTPKENMLHAKTKGSIERGEDRYNVKLSNLQVEKIRLTHNTYRFQKDIADEYNVSRALICKILNNKMRL